jgi:hypothetical protein
LLPGWRLSALAEGTHLASAARSSASTASVAGHLRAARSVCGARGGARRA